jgi:hypothetical protein
MAQHASIWVGAFADEWSAASFPRPRLTLADLQPAWWYYQTHRDEIEQALREEEEG